MSEAKWLNSLVAYVVTGAQQKAAVMLGYANGSSIYDHILQLEAKRGQMVEREKGQMQPVLTEYGRSYVAQAAATAVLSFIEGAAPGLLPTKSAVQAAGDIERIQAKRVMEIKWDRKGLADLHDIPSEAWERARHRLVERAARLFEVPPTIWQERPSLGGYVEAETVGVESEPAADVWAAVQELFIKRKDQPHIRAIWFVDMKRELLEFEQMFVEGGFLFETASYHSVMGIPLIEYESRLFNWEREFLERPWWMDEAIFWGNPTGKVRRPWFCVFKGIWLEMSDGKHKGIEVRSLVDSLKSMAADG